MRIRTIKPQFFTNDQLAQCCPLARLLFIGTWAVSDREGRLEDRPLRLKVEILPYDNVDVAKLLDELEGQDFIRRYEVDGRRYIWIVHFKDHQRITGTEAEKPSLLPAPPKECLTRHGQPDLPGVPAAVKAERNGRFTPPTPDESAAYAREIRLPQEERLRFLDYYTSNGWKVGRSPMKDWKAAMRNWKRNGETSKADTTPVSEEEKRRLIHEGVERANAKYEAEQLGAQQ